MYYHSYILDNKDELFVMNVYNNWKGSLDSCKNKDSNLLGNVATEAELMEKIRKSKLGVTTRFKYWLGIARQIYLTTDTGESFVYTNIVIIVYG